MHLVSMYKAEMSVKFVVPFCEFPSPFVLIQIFTKMCGISKCFVSMKNIDKPL